MSIQTRTAVGSWILIGLVYVIVPPGLRRILSGSAAQRVAKSTNCTPIMRTKQAANDSVDR